MKPYLKITIPALVIVMLLNASCQKNNVTLANKSNVDTALASKSRQIALGFNKSFQSSLTNSPNQDTKTSGTTSLRVFDAQNPCGSSVVKKTNYSKVIGGDIYNYIGNSIFTYMCDGIYNNGFNVDAYTLKDTLNVYGGGPDSPNSEYTAFNYVVKAADSLYKTITISGSQAHNTTRIAIGFGLNEKSNESYQWQNVIAKRTDTEKPIIQSGTITFNISYANYFMGKGDVADLFGYMEYLPDNMMRVTFVFNGSSTKVYLVNTLTGKVTAV